MDFLLDIAARLIAFSLGLWLVLYTILSALRTFVLPRGAYSFITSMVFLTIRRSTAMLISLKKNPTYEDRDSALALLSPISLFLLPLVWLTLITLGYTGMMWALSVQLSWRDAFILSGSSLMTLGFAFDNELQIIILSFTEAALGMMLIALLIGYLPTMYTAFSQREKAVNQLEVGAGSPPSAVEMVKRMHRLGLLYDQQRIEEYWAGWALWFTEIEESHTSIAPLNFFRSPKPQNSWITSAGTVLDCAALVHSTVQVPHSIQSQLAIRAGFIALRSICDFFSFPYNPTPKQGDPISISREEFDEAYQDFVEAGIPVNPDPDDAWLNFAGWRVNYDVPLLRIASLLYAPYAPWISDRSIPKGVFESIPDSSRKSIRFGKR